MSKYTPKDRRAEFDGITVADLANRLGVNKGTAYALIRGTWKTCTPLVEQRLDAAYAMLNGQDEYDAAYEGIKQAQDAIRTLAAERDEARASAAQLEQQVQDGLAALERAAGDASALAERVAELESELIQARFAAEEAARQQLAMPQTAAECHERIAALRSHLTTLPRPLWEVLVDNGHSNQGWVIFEDAGKVGPVLRMPHPMARKQLAEQYDELTDNAVITGAQARTILDRIAMLEDK